VEVRKFSGTLILVAHFAWPPLRQLLLQLINEKPSIIQDYETGKAIPNPQVCTAAILNV
jgi:hypothetical protein